MYGQVYLLFVLDVLYNQGLFSYYRLLWLLDIVGIQ